MAKYNTFVVIDTHNHKTVLVTSSARKAAGILWKARRIEIWNDNKLVKTLHFTDAEDMEVYKKTEKEYIGMKQLQAEVNNLERGILRA